MNGKDELYDAIKEFADGDEDVYNCLKKDVYFLTHTDNSIKFRSTVSMILFFTNHDKKILDALNLLIQHKKFNNEIDNNNIAIV